MKISAIVAMAENRVIGVSGQLPWRLPEDLKRFKAITLGHPIIMGRKTFDSIGRPLPGRENLVLSRTSQEIPGTRVFQSIADTLAHCEKQGFQEVFIIGGAEIYTMTLPQVDRLYLTLVQGSISGDAFFPEFDWEEFQEVSREERKEPIAHSYLVLERNK